MGVYTNCHTGPSWSYLYNCYCPGANKGLALATEAVENMNRPVSVQFLCTMSIQTLTVPDVDMKLKLPGSILIKHLNLDRYIHFKNIYMRSVYLRVFVLQKRFVQLDN